MEYMSNLLQESQNYMPYFISGLLILLLALVIIVIILYSKVNSLQRRLQRMMQGMEGANIEQMMLSHIAEVKDAVATVERLNGESKRLEIMLQACVQRVGLVRFNAFEDTGSDLSFSLALLDERNNGVVLSSLYGRNESRVYAKPVVSLQSKYVLSAEEQKAISLAKESAISMASRVADNNGLLTVEERDLLRGKNRK